ncbi:hypothetical protein ADU37_CDS10340 [Thermococcus sp. 2319x1]|uniref:hypothetical protein n=1 Tax=Thermococcus sp. 2319x1 TaxID=1674923 RepID=UPI00073A813B|nr:hypothetical protein [Thermococcus sp. 2319x1]ALV62733.1 hypothetical protein ADU37_CDS10340 [Thermococcus sp. 2319x1]
MRKTFLAFLLFLIVLVSLCITRPSTTPTPPPNEASKVVSFLNEAKENLNKCNTTLKSPLNPQSDPAYLNMTILNETTLKLNGELYKYVVLGVQDVNFSGEVLFKGYRIIWNTPKNLTTTGGQRIDFKIYKGSSVVDSFIYWYIPFQLDSYCVSIYTKTLSLPEEKMTFIFIHIEEKDLWMALAKNKY